MIFRKIVLAVAGVVLTLAQLALGQGTYTQIDVPGAILTYCFGIDTAGDIVGSYEDTSATYHGFLLSNGMYTTVDYPNQSFNEAVGINPAGTQIAGQFNTGTNAGWLYDVSAQTFREISVHGFTQTAASAVNNSGTVVGFILNDSPEVQVGFQEVNGTIRKLFPPGFTFSGAESINSSGEVLLYACNSKCSSSLYTHGEFHQIRIPAPYAVAIGMNDTDELVGAYGNATQLTTGFTYQNKVLQSLSFSGAISTIAHGVNNSGEVVGYFLDSTNIFHGFLWTPPADAAKK